MQSAHIKKFITNKLHSFLNLKTILHVLAMVFSYPQGVSILKYVYKGVTELFNCKL